MFDLNIPVLVVEDMSSMRRLIVNVIKEIGFTNVTEAGDGAAAWQLIQAANPRFGIIFSDWTMPNTNGLDLLKRIRSDSRCKATPFVMITAEAEHGQIAEALKCGVSNYIIKPFTTELIRDKLEFIYKKIHEQAS